MSVFTSGEANQATTETAQTSYLKTLVELKGDQWNDPEVIAKGKIDADNHIEQLKAQIKELEAKANQSGKLDEILAKIGQEAAKPPVANTQSSEGDTKRANTQPVLSEDQIQSLVEKTLTERERTQTVAQNINQVNKQLEDLFGTEAKKRVEDKAKELGMSLSRIQEIASESPTAFFTLIGEKPAEFKPSLNSTIRTDGLQQRSSDVRNNKYYQDLRRSNQHQFYSASVQKQMMEDRQRLGASFYN